MELLQIFTESVVVQLLKASIMLLQLLVLVKIVGI